MDVVDGKAQKLRGARVFVGVQGFLQRIMLVFVALAMLFALAVFIVVNESA